MQQLEIEKCSWLKKKRLADLKRQIEIEERELDDLKRQSCHVDQVCENHCIRFVDSTTSADVRQTGSSKLTTKSLKRMTRNVEQMLLDMLLGSMHTGGDQIFPEMSLYQNHPRCQPDLDSESSIPLPGQVNERKDIISSSWINASTQAKILLQPKSLNACKYYKIIDYVHSITQQYLAYLVKTMKLATWYEWKSVLYYDDHFRQLQAMYNIPWVFESHHLNTVRSIPLVKPVSGYRISQPGGAYKKKKYSTNFSHTASVSNFNGELHADYTVDGRVICRMFNGTNG